jgi:hypothetical protein
MAFQVLEFGQGVVDLAGSTQAIDAVRVLCGHELVLVVIGRTGTHPILPKSRVDTVPIATPTGFFQTCDDER